MSSGVAYPMPVYIPPLPVFNSLFFPQSFGTTTTSGGGGGGFTNIFPNGLTSGNVITMDGGTGGGGGTGVERTITGLSQIEWVDITDTNPTAITGYMVLNGNTLEIGSNTASSGINVNLLGSVVSANGTPIGGGGDVFLAGNNTFTGTNDFQSTFTVDNALTNIGQLGNNNTAIGDSALITLNTGNNNTAFGNVALTSLTTGANNTAIGNIALTSLTTGVNNTAIGHNTLNSETTGSQNIAVGVLSLNSLTQGNINTAVGYASLNTSTLDNGNTAIGINAGFSLNGNGSNSNYNTFIGIGAGKNQLTGSNNIAIGQEAGASSAIPNLSNTIAIGYLVSPTNNNDIILAPNGNTSYVKFSNVSNAGWCLESQSASYATLKILGTGGVSAGLAGRLQIGAGTDGGGSLQVEDNGTNPPTNTGFGNFASVNGLPFYYSPSTSTWSELITTTNVISLTSVAVIAGGLGTQWRFTPLVIQPISTFPTPPYGNTFNFTVYTNITSSPQSIPVVNTQLNIQGLFTSITGTGVAQQYTYSGTTYWGYVLSSTIISIGALTDLQFEKNLVSNNNNFYFTCSSTDPSLLTTTLELIINPNP